MPKVSVIIPIYNVEKYLSRCLDSVINQTLQDIEIILIDDCSTDNSLEIAQDYAARDKRIKLIALENNQGAAVARNKGLEIANGEYLGFIDPDDDIDLNYYEELYKKALETGADIVKCIRKTIDEQGVETVSNLNEIIKNGTKFDFTYEWTTAIYRASLIYNNNINFPPEIIKAQDIVFLSRVIFKTKTLELIDNVYYYYYRREGSLNARKISLEKIKSATLAVEYLLNQYNSALGKELNNDLYIQLYKMRITSLLSNIFEQNDSIEAKRICIRKYLELFQKCKTPNKLEEHYIKNMQEEFLKLVKGNKEEEILNLFLKYKTLDNCFRMLRLKQLRDNVKKDIKHSF